MLVPRTVRMFVQDCLVDQENGNTSETDASVSLTWPPAAPTASPASLAQSSSSPLPTASAASPFVEEAPTSAQLDHNLNKFNFEGKGFPPSQVLPDLSRERFTVSNCGPT
ncbi:hypothetical protein O0L34_g3655 [Tuta absoluta]|nr:hypothetical protein O0L34_g3655 [Tuta absoluta]